MFRILDRPEILILQTPLVVSESRRMHYWSTEPDVMVGATGIEPVTPPV
jgi:hypothetical protein